MFDYLREDADVVLRVISSTPAFHSHIQNELLHNVNKIFVSVILNNSKIFEEIICLLLWNAEE